MPHISIIAKNFDESDNLVRFDIVCESNAFKGSIIDFFAYPDEFKEFAQELLRFPFESKEQVVYNTFNDKIEGQKYAYDLRLEVSLKDSAGRVNFAVHIRDQDNQECIFSDIVEVQSLHEFAKQLLAADFTELNRVQWPEK